MFVSWHLAKTVVRSAVKFLGAAMIDVSAKAQVCMQTALCRDKTTMENKSRDYKTENKGVMIHDSQLLFL